MRDISVFKPKAESSHGVPIQSLTQTLPDGTRLYHGTEGGQENDSVVRISPKGDKILIIYDLDGDEDFNENDAKTAYVCKDCGLAHDQRWEVCPVCLGDLLPHNCLACKKNKDGTCDQFDRKIADQKTINACWAHILADVNADDIWEKMGA